MRVLEVGFGGGEGDGRAGLTGVGSGGPVCTREDDVVRGGKVRCDRGGAVQAIGILIYRVDKLKATLSVWNQKGKNREE